MTKVKYIALCVFVWVVAMLLSDAITPFTREMEARAGAMITRVYNSIVGNDLKTIKQQYLQARQEYRQTIRWFNAANIKMNKKVESYPQVFDNIDSNMLDKIEILENKYWEKIRELASLLNEFSDEQNKVLKANEKVVKIRKERGELIEAPQISKINEILDTQHTNVNEINLLGIKILLAAFEIRKLRDKFTFSNKIENKLYKAFEKVSKYEDQFLPMQKKSLEKESQFFEASDSEFLKIANEYEEALKKHNQISQKYIVAINELLKVVDEAKESVGIR